MPRNPTGKTKSQRIHALREVFRRWGKLDKPRIDELVSGHLGIPVEGLRKPLYRDLQELVESGEIIVRYYSSSGSEIADFDSTVHVSSRAEWALVGSEHKVLGQNALSLAGGALYPLSRLVREIRVDSGSPEFEENTIHLFFSIQSTFFCLKLPLESIPVTVVVSRAPGPFDGNPPIKEIEDRFGKRCALLQIPNPGVSAIKPGERLGHAVIKFSQDRSVEIFDLGSTNGTKFHPLSLQDAEVLRKSGDLLGKQTATAEWIAAFEALVSWQMAKNEMPASCPLPVLVRFSQEFHILIA